MAWATGPGIDQTRKKAPVEPIAVPDRSARTLTPSERSDTPVSREARAHWPATGPAQVSVPHSVQSPPHSCHPTPPTSLRPAHRSARSNRCVSATLSKGPRVLHVLARARVRKFRARQSRRRPELPSHRRTVQPVGQIRTRGRRRTPPRQYTRPGGRRDGMLA